MTEGSWLEVEGLQVGDIILTLQVLILFHTFKLWEVWNFKVTNDKGFVTREKVNMKLKELCHDIQSN